jgi:hypothetical protein
MMFLLDTVVVPELRKPSRQRNQNVVHFSARSPQKIQNSATNFATCDP